MKRCLTMILVVFSGVLFFAVSAMAQQEFPGEKAVMGIAVNANVYVITASNCRPYSRGCLGVQEFPTTISLWTYLSPENDVRLRRGFAAFTPFTDCPLTLPYPRYSHEIIQRDAVSVPVKSVHLVAPGIPFLSPATACLFSPVDWEEIAALAERGTPLQPLSTYLRLGKMSTEAVGRLTAIYGYSRYMGGKRFHEGLDTSWNAPGENVIVSPIPYSPLIVRGGWGMSIAPCALEPAMMREDAEAIVAFKQAMADLENGQAPPGLDCAILFGGFHIVSENPYLPLGRAAEVMSHPSAKGKTPWEMDLIYPPRTTMAMCATVSGYAGDFVPHCHYQASIVPGDVARELIATLRGNPGEMIRSLDELVQTRNRDWGGLWSTVYRYSVDPALFLLPEATAECVQDRTPARFAECWAGHRWPEGGWIPTNTLPMLHPTAYWRSANMGEYLPGIHSPGGTIEQLGGAECKIYNKEVPGCYCYPSTANYYNTSDSSYSVRMVNETARRILPALQRYICAKIHRCGSGSSPPAD